MIAARDDPYGYIYIQSNGVEFTILALIPMIMIVFLVFWARKFYLTKRTGIILFALYLLFLSFAVLIEVDVIFKPNFCP